LLAIMLSILVGKLRGGRLRRLGNLQMRAYPLLLAGLLLQMALHACGALDVDLPLVWASVVHVASYGLLLYAILVNLRLAGMPLVATGMALNLAVIAANRGRMPISTTALMRAGLHGYYNFLATGASYTHQLADSHTRLWCLGDVLFLPRPFPRPCVLSVGDLFLVVGLFLLIQHFMLQPDGS